MVLLHSIIKKLAGTDANSFRHLCVGLQFPNRPMRSRIGTQRDDARCSVVLHGLPEECFRRSNVASFAQPEIHGSTLLINCPIPVRPAAVHLYIGLVTTP